MSHPEQSFLTVAGRWRQRVAASGIDKTLPRNVQAVALAAFYDGFGAALDAAMEVTAFDEAEAVELLQALRTEVQQLEAMASRIFGGAATN